MDSKTTVKPLRVIAAGLMLAAGVSFLAFAMSGSEAANRDFIWYWAAGKQLIHYSNPYDGPAILHLLHDAGYQYERPFFMRNPPYAFFLALPLGLTGPRSGIILWSLALIAALMTSVRMLWSLHGRPPERLHLIGYIFPPALACLLAGQVGIFILLGVVLFLYLHESNPLVAGGALLLCALKPHLLLPFGAVLLLWCIAHRKYRILAGCVGALFASSLLSFLIDPAGWTQYSQMIKAEHIQNEFIPTVSLLFRLALHRNALWLQFVPALAGCIWAIWYLFKHRERWSWMEHGPLLLLVSVTVAPYAWFTDEAVLLPAIFAGLYRASSRALLAFGCIAAIALLEVLTGVSITSGFYIWTAPTWLAWYIYANKHPCKSNVCEPPPLVAENA